MVLPPCLLRDRGNVDVRMLDVAVQLNVQLNGHVEHTDVDIAAVPEQARRQHHASSISYISNSIQLYTTCPAAWLDWRSTGTVASIEFSAGVSIIAVAINAE